MELRHRLMIKIVMVTMVMMTNASARKANSESLLLELNLVAMEKAQWLPIAYGRRSLQCGPEERRTRGVPRRERFCNPRLTRPTLLRRRRRCVCKPGFIRNAWGQCITRDDCDRCKKFPHMDFNVCESDCPLTCARPIPFFCIVHCARGCACPPGYVIDPVAVTKGCVSAKDCPPRCPRHSSYQQCVSTCEPRCDVLRPKKCMKHCHSGDCVCEEGYAKIYKGGNMRCVPTFLCPKRYEELYGQFYFVNIGR